jgi:hypothetical protein
MVALTSNPTTTPPAAKAKRGRKHRTWTIDLPLPETPTEASPAAGSQPPPRPPPPNTEPKTITSRSYSAPKSQTDEPIPTFSLVIPDPTPATKQREPINDDIITGLPPPKTATIYPTIKASAPPMSPVTKRPTTAKNKKTTSDKPAAKPKNPRKTTAKKVKAATTVVPSSRPQRLKTKTIKLLDSNPHPKSVTFSATDQHLCYSTTGDTTSSSDTDEDEGEIDEYVRK